MKDKITKYFSLYTKSLAFVWKSCPWLCAILLCTIPVQALLPSGTLYLTNLIINMVQYNTTDKIISCLIIWCIFFILNNLIAPFNVFIQGQLTDKLTYYLNFKIMKKSEDIQDIGYFEDSTFYNKINLLSSEAAWRPVNLLVYGSSIISNIIMLLSMLVLLSSFHVWIAVVLFAAMFIQGIISYKIQQQAFETLVANTEDSRKLSYFSEVTLTAQYIKDVRLYNLYAFFQNKYKLTYEQIRKAVQKNRVKQFAVSVVFLIISGVFSAFCFSYIIDGVAARTFEIGAIIIFTSSILYSVQGITMLVQDTSLLYDTLLYMENLFDYLLIKDPSGKGNEPVPDNFEKIKFNNVSFSYPNSDRAALQNISFQVKKAEKIAIVGENGAGKSTLIKLLLRMYKTDTDSIFFDDKPVQQMNIIDYRKKFTAVFQDFAEFDLSLKENIILSALSECDDKVRLRQALSKSGMNISELGVNLEQMLGKKFEDGRELSGGQWQRIALARAFFSNSDIMVLDEPTSALDAKMEKFIFDKFYELADTRTVFFITHRLAMVRKADRILVLKDGQLCGFDTHENLLQKNAYYAELYHMQADLFESKE